MPIFTYKAKDTKGKTIQEQMIAKDTAEVLLNLRQKNLVAIAVIEVEKKKLPFSKARGVKLSQLAQFSRRLSTLVGAGIPLVKDLKVLTNQMENKRLQKIAMSLSQYIEAGNSFSESLRNYPAVFTPFYINMVSAGEASGALNDILERIANYLEKTDSLIRRTKSAMIYPSVIIFMGIALSTFLILVVIPRFKEIFALLGTKLPLLTQLLLGFSDFCRRYFLYALGALFLLGWSLKTYVNTARGRFKFDSFKLKIPLLGGIFRKFFIARFTRTLATLLNSGVPILNSLDIVAKTAGNDLIESRVMEIRQQVSQGQRMATQLAKEKIFPPIVSEMVGVGEESGQLEQMLSKVADAYEEEVETAVNGLLSLLEPFIIVSLGLVVGTIVLAMFLPILKITEALGVR